MRLLSRQLVVPFVLILVGVGQLMYGVGFRSAPILVEKEVSPPPRPPMMPPAAPNLPFLNQPLPPPPPPPKPEKVLVTVLESEMRLIRDVTVGGVTLLASGELKRTYTGAPPSLCPT